MTSVLNVDTIADKAGTGPVALTKQHPAKVWAFTTDNVITDSFNTSSSTDNETGHYTITLTSAMDDANFAVLATVNENNNFILGNRERAAGSYGIRIKNTSGTGQDANTGSVAHGDLA